MLRMMRKTTITILLVILVFTTLNCEKGVAPEDVPGIELSVENVGATEVWLRVKFSNLPLPVNYSVERDGLQILSGVMHKADTLLIDVSASPKKSYNYRAAQLAGNAKKIESDELQVITLDTTSHNITWQVDTLGVRGTVFDVWAFTPNNIWALGEIYTEANSSILYNLAQWDGQLWTISRILYNQTSISPVRGIFAFTENDIWIGLGTQPMHWNGTQWQQFDVTSMVFNGYINKIWGTSSSNIFIVGTNGSIAHYNGITWRKMESGTTVDLEDIWGIDGNNIWAAGTHNQTGQSVVLKSDGSRWSLIYNNFDQPKERDFAFGSVWTNNSSILWLVGLSIVTEASVPDQLFKQHQTGQKFISYRLRAPGKMIFLWLDKAAKLCIIMDQAGMCIQKLEN